MDGFFSGRHLVEALKFVLLACPKETEENNGDSSYVVFSGNRVVSGDGYRWHIAYLEDGVKMRPTCATRASVQALRDVLGGVKKSVGKEGTFKIRVDGLMVDVQTEDEPMIRTLARWRSGSWPEGWEPTVPTGFTPADTSRVDGKFLREAASWKDSTAVFAGDAEGPVRVDSYVVNTLVSRAVLLTIDSPPADTSDARQGQMFPSPSRPADSVGREVREAINDFKKSARRNGVKVSVRVGDKETVIADGTKAPEGNFDTDPTAKLDKPAKKKAKPSLSLVEAEEKRDEFAREIRTAATGHQLGSAWLTVASTRSLPDAMRETLAVVWREQAKELSLTPDTIASLRRRGEAPPEASGTASASA